MQTASKEKPPPRLPEQDNALGRVLDNAPLRNPLDEPNSVGLP